MKTQRLNFINKRIQMFTTIIINSRGFNIRFASSSSQNNPFFVPIPVNYIASKEKPLNVYFSLIEMYNFIQFCTKIKSIIEWNTKYTVYIKVRYRIDNYFMAGNQFGFSYDSENSLDDLYTTTRYKLEDYFKDYFLEDVDVVYVQISFRKNNLKLLADFKKDIEWSKDVLNALPNSSNDSSVSKDVDSNNKSLSIINNDNTTLTTFVKENRGLTIPISVHRDSLGNRLNKTVKNSKITHIAINIGGDFCNFLDIIKNNAKLIKANHKDNIISFDKGFDFYYFNDRFPYVLAVNMINDFKVEKMKFSLKGVLLEHVIDSKDNDLIKRTSLNESKQIIVKDNKVIYMKKNISLRPINKPKKVSLFVSNPNIGAIDTETYTDYDGVNKIYALGFRTNLNSKPIIYYIDKENLDSRKIVLDMVNELLRPKYSKTVFYCHNLSGYDVVFILKILSEYNETTYDKYNISSVLRKDKIIQITISKNKHKFTIKDSYAILPDSLYNLGKNFEVETLKTRFPYNFAKKENLFYIGDTPNKIHYKDISDEEYNSIYRKDWSFYQETVKYLENDINSLYQIMCKANKQVFNDYGVNLTDSVTISGLAVRIFLKDFYKENIPSITKASLYNDIKQAYYGGITEVYKPCGYNLYYYDVNSLYPYVALQDMPGLVCSKLLYYTKDCNINDLFGFFYCYVESPVNSYIGLLPVRDDSGINFPVGKWTGWYFSEELKFAKANGYVINVIEVVT